jgi:hypothetical protein
LKETALYEYMDDADGTRIQKLGENETRERKMERYRRWIEEEIEKQRIDLPMADGSMIKGEDG